MGENNTSRKRTKKPASSPLIMGGKLPPQAVDIEEAILGAVLLEKSAIHTARRILKPEAFYKENHQKIFQACIDLDDKDNPIDILTATMELKSKGELDVVGGPYYISQLTNKTASASNMEYHATIVKEKYIQREQIRISSEIITDAYDDTIDVFTTNDKMGKGLSDLLINLQTSETKTNSQILRQATQDIEDAKKNKGITGIETGFLAVDDKTGGWQNSDLIYIAARPAMGKTALVLSMARNTAIDFEKHLAFFSLEMSHVQLMKRLISQETDMDAIKLKKGDLDSDDWSHYNKNVGSLETEYLHVYDDIFDIQGIKSKCIEMSMEGKLDCIVVDYLQLIEYPQYSSNREREISQISRTLKLLAKTLNVPVICISQLSRKVEERAGKVPQLSDLRDSGSIEQDADMVVFLFRGAYYEMDGVPDNLALFMIKKHRNGDLGTIKLNFEGAKVKFSNWDDGSNDDSEDSFP